MLLKILTHLAHESSEFLSKLLSFRMCLWTNVPYLLLLLVCWQGSEGVRPNIWKKYCPCAPWRRATVTMMAVRRMMFVMSSDLEWEKEISSKNYWEVPGCCGSGVGPASCYGSSMVRFPCSACQRVLGQDTEPQTAPDVLVGTLHGSHQHQCMNVCMNYCAFFFFFI